MIRPRADQKLGIKHDVMLRRVRHMAEPRKGRGGEVVIYDCMLAFITNIQLQFYKELITSWLGAVEVQDACMSVSSAAEQCPTSY